jgi:hypothetical protein
MFIIIYRYGGIVNFCLIGTCLGEKKSGRKIVPLIMYGFAV